MARKLSKNTVKARAGVEARPYLLADAIPLIQKIKFAKFDENVDLTSPCASASIPAMPTRWSVAR